MKFNKSQRLEIYKQMLEIFPLHEDEGLCHILYLTLFKLHGNPLFNLQEDFKELFAHKPAVTTFYWFDFDTAGKYSRISILEQCIAACQPKRHSLVEMHRGCLSQCQAEVECITKCIKI